MLLINIRKFDLFNRTYGDQQGDLLRRETAQVILMNLRDEDLACRYASDHFIVLMRTTAVNTAEKVTVYIEQSIANLGFEVGNFSTEKYQNVTCCAMQFHGADDYRVTLDKLNEYMQTIKDNKQRKLSA